MVFSVFVYAYRVSLDVSERQPNPQFTLSLARADRLQAGMCPLSIISLWHLYLCLLDRCGQKIHKSKKDKRFLFVQFYTVCLFYSYVFSVRTGPPTIPEKVVTLFRHSYIGLFEPQVVVLAIYFYRNKKPLWKNVSLLLLHARDLRSVHSYFRYFVDLFRVTRWVGRTTRTLKYLSYKP